MRVNLVHKVKHRLTAHFSRFQLGKRLFVIRGVGQHDHVAAVFGGASEHRRPAYVYVFHNLVEALARHNRLLKRVKVDYNHVYSLDFKLLQTAHMFGIVSFCKQPRVNCGMKRLYPAVETLGKAGNVAYVESFQAGVFKTFLSASRADNLISHCGEPFRRVHDAVFVAYAYQRSFFHDFSSRCIFIGFCTTPPPLSAAARAPFPAPWRRRSPQCRPRPALRAPVQ